MSTRLLIKTSEVNATPQPSDLIARELAFSFVSDGLFIKYPDNTVRRINLNGNGEWGNIVGTLSDQTDLVAALNNKQNLLSPGAGITINSGQISVDYNAIANKPTLGNSATLNTGTTAGTVALGNHTHTKANVGLDQVDNTSDVNKPISNAVQAALNNKQDRLTEGANITIDENGVISATGVGGSTIISWSAIQNKPDTFPPSTHYHNKGDIGLDQVDNTSDVNKPISNAVQAVLNSKEDSANKGQANGYAPLDSNGDVPLVNIPDSLKGAFIYQGAWDANVNFPQLSNEQAINKGFCYKVSAAGTTNLSGISDWAVGDYVVANGSAWDRWKASSDVTSVAGKKGIVTLTKADVGLSNVDNTSDANKPISIAVQAALDGKETAVNKGQANGYASLDGSAKIPVSQIPSSIASALSYVSDWNASNNTPAIPSASSSNKGNFYIVSVPGATTINGLNTWNVSDWILSTGSSWIRVQVKNDVDSVAGKQGAITLEISDINGLQSALNTAGAVQSVAGKQGSVTLAIADIVGLQAALNAAGASGAVQSVNTKTGVVVLDKNDIGLNNVDNTSDINKQISTAVQSALDGKASIAIATTSSNGLLSSSDKTKLDGVASGATANSTDSFLLNRANHTGSQATSTISGLDTALAGKESTANKGQANGYAGLDSNGKINTSNLPDSVTGSLNYISAWDASTNTPTIPAAASGNKGNYYKVSISGNTTIDGVSGWTAGDWIVSNGTVWEKIHTQETISSVNTKTGAVVLDKTDIGLDQVDNTSDLNKPLSNATIGALAGKASTAVVTTLANGLMSSSDKTKLDGVASGATANSTDLYLLNRDNHTGSQSISTVTGLQSALDGKVSTSAVTVFGSTLIASGDAAAARTNLALGTAAIQDSTYFALASHTHTKANVGLDQVDNTSDINKPISNATQTALNAKEDSANKGQANGYAPLDSTGKLPLGYVTASIVNSVNGLTTSVSDLQTQVASLSAASTAAPDIIQVPFDTTVSGNFLNNIPSGSSTLSVTNFTIYGTTFDVNNSVTISPFGEIIVGDIVIDDQISPINTTKTNVTYVSGTTITISGVGDFTLQSNGDYTFNPNPNFSGTVPNISYQVFDGTITKTYTAIFLVQTNTSSLGDAAYKNTGTTPGTVAAGDDTRILQSLQVKGNSAGAPQSGTFSFGDVYRDSAPLTSGFLYWQCVYGGIDSAAVWSGIGNVTLQYIDTGFAPTAGLTSGAIYTKNYTISKAAAGDQVLLSFNTITDMTGISITGVATTDTVTVSVYNGSGSTVSIVSGTLTVRVIK